MKREYTKEEKIAYFKGLRERWQESKKMAENNEAMKAMYIESKLEGVSMTSFHFVYSQMVAQGLSGIPYVHCKTFNKWKDAGMKVKKGAKSTLDGITWLKAKTKDENGKQTEEDDGYVIPKVYHLFHESQVEPL